MEYFNAVPGTCFYDDDCCEKRKCFVIFILPSPSSSQLPSRCLLRVALMTASRLPSIPVSRLPSSLRVQ
jgi:hypothetical protein